MRRDEIIVKLNTRDEKRVFLNKQTLGPSLSPQNALTSLLLKGLHTSL